MSAYVVFIRENVRDQSALDQYAANVKASFEGHASTTLAAYGATERLEGADVEGVVILQFADTAAATAWYSSPAYQQAAQPRFRGADYRAFVVEGV